MIKVGDTVEMLARHEGGYWEKGARCLVEEIAPGQMGWFCDMLVRNERNQGWFVKFGAVKLIDDCGGEIQAGFDADSIARFEAQS